MTARLSVIFLTVAIGGCAILDDRTLSQGPLIKPPESSEEAMSIAEDYAARGRWKAALDVLDQAVTSAPDDAALRVAQETMTARWAEERRLLEDRILIGDAENQLQKIALLEKLSRAAPNDLVVASRRLYWKEILRANAEPLTECAERYVKGQPALAKRCFLIASDVVETDALGERLAAVGAYLKEGEELAEERRRQRAARERRARARVLLDRAKAAIEADDYRRALDFLKRVADLQPNNPEVAALQQTAWSMISPQIDALVKLGDHLYLNEQLDSAVATWQAALTLKPGDEAIVARIERARTVLERLDSLRKRQRPGGDGR